jgi:hypothetical protein
VEEKKSKEIPKVAASEIGKVHPVTLVTADGFRVRTCSLRGFESRTFTWKGKLFGEPRQDERSVRLSGLLNSYKFTSRLL